MLKPSKLRRHRISRVWVGTVLMLILAAVHGFRVGTMLNGVWHTYYYSFASDIMLPFGAYFMLCMNEVKIKWLRSWVIKGILVFGTMSISELLQYFGIYFFGLTFDPLDFMMYAVGTLLGILLDTKVFVRVIPNWYYDKQTL
jgi:hypothetical protein